MKSALWSIGKYIIAALLLIFILKHAQADRIMGYLQKIPPLKLLLAFSFVALAQVVAALRMRFFFHAAGYEIHRKYAVILYIVGAFYNFLLPGGIGGDAYKIILARRRMEMAMKDGLRIMLADRASGLCIVMMVLFTALMMLDFSSSIPYARVLIVLGAVVTLAGYLFFSLWLVKQPPRTMLASLPYSMGTQGLWIAALLTVLSSLGTGQYAAEYVVLYCAASIAGLIPITVGGLGIKEMTYYGGAKQLQHFAHSGVDGNLGIAISLCLFFLMLAAALPGILWLNKVERVEHGAASK